MNKLGVRLMNVHVFVEKDVSYAWVRCGYNLLAIYMIKDFVDQKFNVCDNLHKNEGTGQGRQGNR